VVSILLRSALALAIAASCQAIAIPYAAPETAANTVALRIEVYAFAGFHVLTNRTTVVTSPDRYTITTDLDTRGIVSLFIDLNSHSEVHGRLVADAAVPEAYRSDVMRNGVDRRYRIDYAGSGPLASEWAPPANAWQSPIPPQKLLGTVDQLTAYFLVERELGERGTCTVTIPVFDGHSRYNLRFKDAGAETSSRRGFTGPTHVCDVTRDDIAGMPGNRDPSEGTYTRGKVWYAKLGPAGRMVPVQIDYDTEFGIVTGYLAELRGPAGTQRFLQ
jgi:hypothetical protein